MQYNPPTGASGANDSYVGKNTAAGIQGSKVPPAAVEFPQREIVNFITATGQTPSNADNLQLLKGVRTNALSYYADAGSADALVITPSPAFLAVPAGAEFGILKMGSPNATTTPTLAVNNIAPVPLKKEDGSALAVGDLPANVMLIVRFVANTYRIVGLRKSDAAAAASNPPTVPIIIQQQIDKSSPRGAKVLSAFTAGAAVTDIAVGPSQTVVLTSGTFTGASFLQLFGACAFRCRETSGNYVGFTARFRLNDQTAGTSADATEYIGAGSQLGGTYQVQSAVSPFKLYQGLDPTHVYSVSIIAQKNAAYGPIDVNDPRIIGLHDGN